MTFHRTRVLSSKISFEVSAVPLAFICRKCRSILVASIAGFHRVLPEAGGLTESCSQATLLGSLLNYFGKGSLLELGYPGLYLEASCYSLGREVSASSHINSSWIFKLAGEVVLPS